MSAPFSALLSRALHRQNLRLIDSEICFASTSNELLDFIVSELRPLLPYESGETAKRFLCIAENTRSVLIAYPDIFAGFIGACRKKIQSMELGEAVLYLGKAGAMMIEVRHIGIFHHDGQGNYLLLVDSNSLASREGHRLNIQGLLNLLISEVLRHSGRCLAHAGGTGRFGRCQLWTGNSGAGKTTRTLHRVSKGEDFYGDDQVIIGPKDDGFWYVWPFWRAVKVTPDCWQHLDGLPFLHSACPDAEAKHVMNNVGEGLAVDKPECGRISAINLIDPKGKGVLRRLGFEEAFRLVAPCFLHTILPTDAFDAIGNVLDLFSEVEIRAVSWDMLKELDALENESQ